MVRTLYAMFFALFLAQPAQAQEDHDYVVVVLDGSGSMAETMGDRSRMAAAKEALGLVLSGLPASTRVGILCFSTEIGDDPWLYPIGPRDDDAIRAAINRAASGGKTPLGSFIKAGADRLMEYRESEHGYGTYRLLVVTDGEASDSDKVDRFAPELVGRGIGLDVIGVAMASDHTLKRFANSYRNARDPETLVQAVTEALAEVTFDGDGATAGETFAFLEGLPDDFAMVTIDALSQVSQLNHPLGQLPPRPAPPAKDPPASPAVAQAPDPAPASGCTTAPVATMTLGLFALFGVRRRK